MHSSVSAVLLCGLWENHREHTQDKVLTLNKMLTHSGRRRWQHVNEAGAEQLVLREGLRNH